MNFDDWLSLLQDQQIILSQQKDKKVNPDNNRIGQFHESAGEKADE